MTTTATATETRWALYRFYDARMRLVYVGKTNEPWRRWREHVLEKPWYPRVKHWMVTFYDTEAEARRAELKAIKGERPRSNIADVPAPVPASFTVNAEVVIWASAALVMLPQLLTIVIGAGHLERLRWLVTAGASTLLLGMVALIVMLVVMFTEQIRSALAWAERLAARIDRHLVNTPRRPMTRWAEPSRPTRKASE